MVRKTMSEIELTSVHELTRNATTHIAQGKLLLLRAAGRSFGKAAGALHTISADLSRAIMTIERLQRLLRAAEASRVVETEVRT